MAGYWLLLIYPLPLLVAVVQIIRALMARKKDAAKFKRLIKSGLIALAISAACLVGALVLGYEPKDTGAPAPTSEPTVESSNAGGTEHDKAASGTPAERYKVEFFEPMKAHLAGFDSAMAKADAILGAQGTSAQGSADGVNEIKHDLNAIYNDGTALLHVVRDSDYLTKGQKQEALEIVNALQDACTKSGQGFDELGRAIADGDLSDGRLQKAQSDIIAGKDKAGQAVLGLSKLSQAFGLALEN